MGLVQLEIHYYWWLWRGYDDRYSLGRGIRSIGDPLDWDGFDNTQLFPSFKPDFDVFGVPRRSRKQRGWYQVLSQEPASEQSELHGLATITSLPPEVINLVIEMSDLTLHRALDAESRRVLGSYALVCQYWATLYEARLHASLRICSLLDFDQLMRFVQSGASAIRRYLNSLTLVDNASVKSDAWIHLVSSLRPFFQRMPTVTVSMAGPLKSARILRSVHHRLPRACPAFSVDITRLELNNLRFSYFSQFLELVKELQNIRTVHGKQLTFVSMAGPMISEQHLRRKAAAMPRLEQVKLTECNANWGSFLLANVATLHRCSETGSRVWYADYERLGAMTRIIEVGARKIKSISSNSFTPLDEDSSGPLLCEVGLTTDDEVFSINIEAVLSPSTSDRILRPFMEENQKQNNAQLSHVKWVNVDFNEVGEPDMWRYIDWKAVDQTASSFPCLEQLTLSFLNVEKKLVVGEKLKEKMEQLSRTSKLIIRVLSSQARWTIV